MLCIGVPVDPVPLSIFLALFSVHPPPHVEQGRIPKPVTARELLLEDFTPPSSCCLPVREPPRKPGTGQALLGKFVTCLDSPLPQRGDSGQVPHLGVRILVSVDTTKGPSLQAFYRLVLLIG